MNEKKIDDILLVGGGIIPDQDVEELEKLGVNRIFGPGTHTTEIVEYIKANAPTHS